MRLTIKLGIEPDRKAAALDLRAAADAPESAVGHWFAHSFNLRNVVAVVSLAGILLAREVTIKSRLAVIEARQQSFAERLDKLSAKQQQIEDRITQQTVSRATYEHDTTQLYFLLGNLESNQQQLYTTMLEARGRTALTVPQENR